MNAPIKHPALPFLPPRRTYQEAPFHTLPFVKLRGRIAERSYWKVPAVHDYAHECAIGREYGAHFVLWLKTHPDLAGANFLLPVIEDMAKADQPGNRGVMAGFVAELERYILAGARSVDPFEVVDTEHRKVAEIEAARDAEKAGRAKEAA
ncbi:MAG: hypothetical protein PHT19_10440 [Methylococcus sp.]|nr:hypothetical protein [Methylococcus sp.]